MRHTYFCLPALHFFNLIICHSTHCRSFKAHAHIHTRTPSNARPSLKPLFCSGRHVFLSHRPPTSIAASASSAFTHKTLHSAYQTPPYFPSLFLFLFCFRSLFSHLHIPAAVLLVAHIRPCCLPNDLILRNNFCSRAQAVILILS